MNYFNSLDMEGWTPDNIPHTSTTSNQKEHSLEPHQQFVMEFLTDPSLISNAQARDGDHEDDLEGFCRLCELFDIFKARSARGMYSVTQSLFTRQLRNLVGADGTEKKVGNQRALAMPTLEVARAAFREETGITHDVFMEGPTKGVPI